MISNNDPYSIGSWYHSKGIGSIELSQLAEFLHIGSYSDIHEGFDLVGEPLPDGPWPETIPGELINKIRSISNEEIASVVSKWRSIEEFGGYASEESLQGYLVDLREFLKTNTGSFYLVNSP